MAFLTKKENSIIALISASKSIKDADRKNAIEKIKYNARLRSDGNRKEVKIFLSVISKIKNHAIAAEILNS